MQAEARQRPLVAELDQVALLQQPGSDPLAVDPQRIFVDGLDFVRVAGAVQARHQAVPQRFAAGFGDADHVFLVE